MNMKIKVKNIKIPGSFPYKDYTCKVDGHKFHAMLGEDGEGKLILRMNQFITMKIHWKIG